MLKVYANLAGKDIVNYDNSAFVKSVKGPGILLVYAHWCGYCREFIPVYEKLSQTLSPRGFPVVAIESSEVAENVQPAFGPGIPAILFFDQSGRVISRYSGPRDMRSILDKICTVYHHCMESH